MPTATYTPLATITLGSSASSVTFSNIPTTPYRDLILIIDGVTGANVAIYARFNSDSTAANYPRVGMAGYGGYSSFSGTEPGIQAGFLTNKNSWILQVMDYSATDKHKTTLSRLQQDTSEVNAVATRWANTNAISSVQLITASSTFSTGTTMSLYGVIA